MTDRNTKVQKRFVDHGCGFPVILEDVPMVKVRGVWTPNIDYNAFHRAVLWALAHKPNRLTGDEIRFIRQYFDMTLVEFGNYFDVSHPAVMKWESAQADAPSIKWSLERDLRLFIIDNLSEQPTALGELYRSLKTVAKPPTGKPLRLSSLAPDFSAHLH